jgi:hypothetical protein
MSDPVKVKLSGPGYWDWYGGVVRRTAILVPIILAIVGLFVLISELWNGSSN